MSDTDQPNQRPFSSFPQQINPKTGESRLAQAQAKVKAKKTKAEKRHEVKNTLLPYPEIARGGKWKITDSYRWKRMSGTTNVRDQKMVVPSSDAGKSITLHEMGHAKWSPANPRNIRSSPTVFNAVEDARVNHAIEGLGMGIEWGDEVLKEASEHIQGDMKAKDYGMALLRGIAAIGTDLEKPFSELLSVLPTRWANAGPLLMDQVRKGFDSSKARNKSEVASEAALYSMNNKVARRLAELEWEDKQEEKEQKEKAKSGFSPTAKPGVSTGGKGLGGKVPSKEKTESRSPELKLGKGAIRPDDHVKTKVKRPKIPKWNPRAGQGSTMRVFGGMSMAAKKFKKVGTEGSGTEEWVPSLAEQDFVRTKDKDLEYAKLFITRPPLCVEQRGVIRQMAGSPTACDEGTVIRRPDRLLIDRAIFARKRKRSGATILVDVSGSMDITPEEIEKVVIAAGCMATVATYCGSRSKGELRIVAEGPMRCSDEDMSPRYGGNVVDLQCLQWLSHMPEPRLWMSDGYVTSSGDVSSEDVLEQCEKVSDLHRITRFWNASEIIRHLEKF